ncbi:PLD nuclease N-terminal domain-containing protein [Streptomyces sp. NPDC002054]|uniref:PLD nuclease N-terminal domain-containing protein n=1 Tax=Streptomyces sp. NPDC002054 TaxID=3154663 RepID=UPI00331940DF
MNPQLTHHITLAATSENTISYVALGVVAVIGIAYAVLFIAALVSIARSALTGAMKLGWIVFACVAPFLGSALWFLIGRRDSQRRPGAVPEW